MILGDHEPTNQLHRTINYQLLITPCDAIIDIYWKLDSLPSKVGEMIHADLCFEIKQWNSESAQMLLEYSMDDGSDESFFVEGICMQQFEIQVTTLIT